MSVIVEGINASTGPHRRPTKARPTKKEANVVREALETSVLTLKGGLAVSLTYRTRHSQDPWQAFTKGRRVGGQS
jgi:hypothetical protein